MRLKSKAHFRQPAGRKASAIIRLILLGAALGSFQSVSAQLAPGRSGQSTLHYLGREEAMSALIGFGRCYARDETAKALRLIATEPTSIEERRTYVALFGRSDEACLGDISRLSADIPLVRGAIVEGFYTRGIPLPAALMQTVPAPGAARNLSEAARCYAASHQQEIRALLADTKPGSRREFEAVERLMPDFFKCVPEGAKFDFSATVIRFRLVEALLRTSGPALTGTAGDEARSTR